MLSVKHACVVPSVLSLVACMLVFFCVCVSVFMSIYMRFNSCAMYICASVSVCLKHSKKSMLSVQHPGVVQSVHP